MVRYGEVRYGEARQGKVQIIILTLLSERYGVVWFGMVR